MNSDVIQPEIFDPVIKWITDIDTSGGQKLITIEFPIGFKGNRETIFKFFKPGLTNGIASDGGIEISGEFIDDAVFYYLKTRVMDEYYNNGIDNIHPSFSFTVGPTKHK